VAVCAKHPVAVDVIQQYELLGNRVLIRSDFASEDAERRLRVPFADSAENLVEGAVFLDDVNDMLEDRGFAGTFGNGFGCRVAALLGTLYVFMDGATARVW